MGAVNAKIHHSLNSDIALIRSVAAYIINSGGKRLRPVTLLLAARALGGSGEKAITLAAVIGLCAAVDRAAGQAVVINEVIAPSS